MAIFTKCFHTLFLFLFLFSNVAHAQQRISCRSCDAEAIRTAVQSAHSNQAFIRFTCPLSIANLSPLSKWGIADKEGNIFTAPTWDSIGTLEGTYAEVYQYLPQRKKAPFKAGLLEIKTQQLLLPINFRSIDHLASFYFKVQTGRGFQLWHSSKGFLSALTYDSIVYTHDIVLLYTEGFIHYIPAATEKVVAYPVKQFIAGEMVFYDTLSLYHNGVLSTVLADSISASKRTDEVILHRNGARIPQHFLIREVSDLYQGEPTPHPVSWSTVWDSTVIKMKLKTGADSMVLLDSWFLYKRKNFWGYGDTLGNIHIGALYDSVGYRYNKRIAMKYRGKWGFLDEQETFILQPYYDEVGDFRFKGAWIRKEKKYNFIDLQGKILNSNWYDDITLTAGHNYVVHYKGKAGLVSKNGREIISTRYLQVLDFGEGSCLTQTEDQKWFLMNYSEYRISNHPYTSVKYLPLSKTYVLKK